MAVVLAALAFAVLVLGSTRPIFDVDSYWHVLMGRDIATAHRVTGDPEWTFGPHRNWVSTQWLGEVIMAGSQALFGWTGLTALRVSFAVATAVTLARTMLRGRPSTARLTIFALALIAVADSAQERPATFVFPLIVVVGVAAAKVLRGGAAPCWWGAAAVTALWANIHGSWILVPVAGVAAFACTLTPYRSPRWDLTPTIALTAACGALSPAGVYAYQAIPRVRESALAANLMEWQPTRWDDAAPLAIVALLVVCAVMFAHSRTRPPLPLVLWLAGWTVFAALAFRNLAPAMLLIAPVAAAMVPQPRAAPRPASSLTLKVGGVVVIGALVVGAVRVGGSGGVAPDVPVRAIAAVGAQPGERRVLTDYNISGPVLALSRPGVRVALDGRADRYRPQDLRAYLNLLGAGPGWQRTVTALRASDAIVRADGPLATALRAHGWSQQRHDGDYVHLTSPRADIGPERDR